MTFVKVTRHGLLERLSHARAVRRGILHEFRSGGIQATFVNSIRRQKKKNIKHCDMCGINILRGKHCKPCSSEVKKRNAGSFILNKVYRI
jgi:recombinational DNA repair protein RecR